MGQLADVGVAAIGLLLQAALDEGLDGLGRVGAELAQGEGLVGDDLRAEGAVGGAAEGGLIAEQLEEGDAQGPDVGAGVDLAGVAHLLRRHVLRRAHAGAGAGEPHVVLGLGHLGDAEVEHLVRGTCRKRLRHSAALFPWLGRLHGTGRVLVRSSRRESDWNFNRFFSNLINNCLDSDHHWL